MDQAGTTRALCIPTDRDNREGEQAPFSADLGSTERPYPQLDGHAVAQLRAFFQLLDRLDRRITEDSQAEVPDEQRSFGAAGSAG